MSETAAHQLVLGETALSNEELAEVTRLEHGIAVLDLFDREIELQDQKQDFLDKIRPGSESRKEILEGPYFKGDELKLKTAANSFRIGKDKEIQKAKVQSLVEYAGFIGVDARIEKGVVITDNPGDWDRVSIGHAQWRVHFGSRKDQIQDQRGRYRKFLQRKIDGIGSTSDMPWLKAALPSEPDLITLPDGPSVNLEDRAVLLSRSINAMAWRSMLSGLNVAIPDEIYNEPIYKRYGVGVPRLDKASSNKGVRLLRSSKWDLWLVSGYAELKKAGMINDVLFKRITRKAWNDYAAVLDHSPNQPKREKVRDQLEEYIPAERYLETLIDGI